MKQGVTGVSGEVAGRYRRQRGGIGGSREVQESAGRYRRMQGGKGGSREV